MSHVPAEAAAVVDAWIDAHNRRELDGLRAVADPDIELHPSVLVGGRRVYHGHQGLAMWIADLAAAGAEHRAQVTDVRVTRSGIVLVFGEVIVDDEPSGPFSMWMRLRDGLVVEARSYLTDQELFSALGVIES